LGGDNISATLGSAGGGQPKYGGDRSTRSSVWYVANSDSRLNMQDRIPYCWIGWHMNN